MIRHAWAGRSAHPWHYRLQTLLPPPYFEWWNAREEGSAVTYDGEADSLAHACEFMMREGNTARCASPPAPPHLRLASCASPPAPPLRPLCVPSTRSPRSLHAVHAPSTLPPRHVYAPSAPPHLRAHTLCVRPVQRCAGLQPGWQHGAPALYGAGARQGPASAVQSACLVSSPIRAACSVLPRPPGARGSRPGLLCASYPSRSILPPRRPRPRPRWHPATCRLPLVWRHAAPSCAVVVLQAVPCARCASQPTRRPARTLARPQLDTQAHGLSCVLPHFRFAVILSARPTRDSGRAPLLAASRQQPMRLPTLLVYGGADNDVPAAPMQGHRG